MDSRANSDGFFFALAARAVCLFVCAGLGLAGDCSESGCEGLRARMGCKARTAGGLAARVLSGENSQGRRPPEATFFAPTGRHL